MIRPTLIHGLHFLIILLDIWISNGTAKMAEPVNIHLTQNLKFRRSDTDRHFQNPCDYPRPSDPQEFSQRCASSYLGSHIFCDPDHQFSRTEADSLMIDLRNMNITSCICGSPITVQTGEFEPCSDLRGGILLVRVGSLKRRDLSTVNLLDLKHYNQCQNWIDQSDMIHELSITEQMQKFVEQIKRIWRNDRCDLDLLIVVIKDWYPSVGPKGTRILAYVSPKLQLHLRNNWHPQSAEISMISIGNQPFDIYYKLKSMLDMMTKGNFSWHTLSEPNPRRPDDRQRRNEESSHSETTATTADSQDYQTIGHTISMPDWAIILFIVCILMLPLCVLIGNLVSVVPSRRNAPAPDQMSMRWANKRWRAGFGGGFFGVRWKTQATTAGEPSKGGGAPVQPRAKPQSNNMMFRQFTKFKKKSTTNAAGAEPKMSGWSYV